MNSCNYMKVQKGDLFYADLGKTIGSEQSGVRPVIVIQNNVGNKYMLAELRNTKQRSLHCLKDWDLSIRLTIAMN